MGVKYVVNENFFQKWSPVMAYVLGYIYADGSLEDASYLRGKYLRVSSVEKNNIIKIKNWLDSKHKIVESFFENKNHQNRYLLRIGSHKIFDDLIKLGLFPNKSLTVKFPKIPKKYLCNFVCGYFDGDGCVRVDRKKNKNGEYVLKKLSVIFTSGSKIFLEGLANELNLKIKTKQLKIYNGHRSFMLSYFTEDSVKIFKFLYRDCKEEIFLRRKFDKFFDYFKLRPQRVDKKIKKIIKDFDFGRVVK